MAELDKYPAEDVVVYFDTILSRSRMWSPAKDLIETAGHMIIYPTIEEARMIWAGMKWLEVYLTMNVGIEQRRHPLPDCIEMLRGAVNEMKAQPADEKMVTLSRRDLQMLSDATTHLDRFCISKTKEPARKYPKGAKKK